jgi:hypothetical protein
MRTLQQPKAARHTAPAEPATLGRADSGRSPAASSIIHLQRTIGNQAVRRRLRADPGDGIAGEVMQGHAPAPSRGVQRDALDAGPGRLSRGGPVAERLAKSRVDVPEVSGIGRKLGFDFSAVRVYAGVEAAGDALALGANAYASGRDVVVGEEPAALATPRGRRLLTHELVHVAQQGAAPPLGRARGAEAPLSAADAERAADRVADAPPMASRPGPIGSVPAGMVQRQGHTISSARIEALRQLARNPQNFAVGRANAWQRLTTAERGAVMMAMDQWYGVPFTSAFVRFANARQLVAGGINLSRGGTLGEAIFDRTDRSLWRTPRFPATFPSCTTLVYPDGSEFARCAAAPPPPAPTTRVRSAVDEARGRQSSGDFAGASAALERERTTVESMEREAAIAAGMDPSVTDHDRVVDFIARRGAMFMPVRLPQEVVDWYTVRNDVRAGRTRPQTEDEMLEEILRDDPPPPPVPAP